VSRVTQNISTLKFAPTTSTPMPKYTIEEVILVDENDRAIGTLEKLRAHQEGILHRAFSIFVFDSTGRLLLQRRSSTKYHSANLWSNTCCGHPTPGESVSVAAHRRLKEEMNFDCELRESFRFTYRVRLDRSLFEHEYDYVLVGEYNNDPVPDVKEVSDWMWISIDELKADMQTNYRDYTYWLRCLIATHEVKIRIASNQLSSPTRLGFGASSSEQQ
jgi:isopentenyl-diphosphate delta-isomerase